MDDVADSVQLSFWGHILVLRNYVLIGAGFFLTVAIFCFVYLNDLLIALLLDALKGQTLLFLTPTGPFLFKLKIAAYVGLVVSFPFWFGLMLYFVSPALSTAKKYSISIFALLSFLLGAASCAINYFYFVPTTLAVLQSFTVPGTESALTAESYLSFYMMLLLVVFIVLQIPLVLAAFSHMQVLNPYILSTYRKYSTLGIIATLALVTPTTDATTLLIVCIPALLLWEVGLAVSKLLYKK